MLYLLEVKLKQTLEETDNPVIKRIDAIYLYSFPRSRGIFRLGLSVNQTIGEAM